jgi:hypothetical protein
MDPSQSENILKFIKLFWMEKNIERKIGGVTIGKGSWKKHELDL